MAQADCERVLVIADGDRQIRTAAHQALPWAQIHCVDNYFDGIAELARERFPLVLASAEPIERRPESAIATLRQLGGESRIVLFAHPTLEPMSQRMLQWGCDDYLISPVHASEIVQAWEAPPRHFETINGHEPVEEITPDDSELESASVDIEVPDTLPLSKLDLARIVLDALVQSPQDAVSGICERINAALPPSFRLAVALADATPQGTAVIAHPLGDSSAAGGRMLFWAVPEDIDRSAAVDFLEQLSDCLVRVQTLQERQASLQRLAITDDLTGIHNARYFRHFLNKIIAKAREMRFAVTLFLFDIDHFKQYNDRYGHAMGDQILKQTAALMRRCVREHDLVARIGGDEFAMVFWEKEGPRQPREPRGADSRSTLEIQKVLERFQKLLATEGYSSLGLGGQGSLTISGGLALFPWHAHDANSLIDAADKQLIFGAKRAGRNTIHLVGADPAKTS